MVVTGATAPQHQLASQGEKILFQLLDNSQGLMIPEVPPTYVMVEGNSCFTAFSHGVCGFAPVENFFTTLSCRIEALNRSGRQALSNRSPPSTKQEAYRFTDMTPITSARMAISAPPSGQERSEALVAGSALELEQETVATIVILNGRVVHISRGPDLAPEVYLGSAQDAPQDTVSFALGTQTAAHGSFFAALNDAAASDVLVLHVPPGCAVAGAVHIVHLTSHSDEQQQEVDVLQVSFPRVLVFLEEGSSARLVQEYAELTENGEAHDSLVDSVTEIELDDGAELHHICVLASPHHVARQRKKSGTAQGRKDLHNNGHRLASQEEDTEDEAASSRLYHNWSTFVRQSTSSAYSLVEARVQGTLTRHDVVVEQLGAETHTELRSFLLVSHGALHDLHSSVLLDHPRGEVRQLHKCIVADGAARGVFDGLVRVGQRAQRTNAGQLSRSLLLAPRATVNAKPTLQIIADDVTCTHGATVSDLEPEQLFYFRARGLEQSAARRLLVTSFGGEVTRGLQDARLEARIDAAVRAVLPKH